ncbi:DNA-processing protein DprA [Nocardia sp. NRRL S-836]|uniref:DNA-processing protein DprA n=1 Tax=Nocardia sp. NRRL S-836 TaxID=1519492 RepID=UPI0018D07D20|nr:DNA-processing protein DprA [Nocardia sp. NRRL S-836]
MTMIAGTEQSAEIRLARAHLSRLADSLHGALAALVAEVGPVEASRRVRCGDVAFTAKSTMSASEAEDRAHQDLELITSRGGRLVIPEDEEWPARAFAELSEETSEADRHHSVPPAPLALWVRGPHALADAVDKAVAVIGSRAASGYGVHVASEFGYGLAEGGVTVVSDGGYGIADAAHRGALQAEGVTIAVLAGGADVAYPAGQQRLLTAIAERGLVISEQPPGVTPAQHRFLTRNRLIAALGAGTVVVEAGRRSGAKNTAAILALGRVLMAVPGPVTSVTSIGCHELIRGGIAVAVGSVAEVVESVPSFGASPTGVPTGDGA